MSVFSSQPCASNQILSNSIFNQWILKEHLLFTFPSRRNVEQEALIENRCKLRSQLAFSRQLEVKWGWRVWKGNIQPVWVELTISLLELMVLWNHISQILLRFDAISARWDVWTQTFFPAQNGQWPVGYKTVECKVLQNLQSQKEGSFQSRQHNEVVVPIRTKSQQKRFKEEKPDLKIRVFLHKPLVCRLWYPGR